MRVVIADALLVPHLWAIKKHCSHVSLVTSWSIWYRITYRLASFANGYCLVDLMRVPHIRPASEDKAVQHMKAPVIPAQNAAEEKGTGMTLEKTTYPRPRTKSSLFSAEGASLKLMHVSSSQYARACPILYTSSIPGTNHRALNLDFLSKPLNHREIWPVYFSTEVLQQTLCTSDVWTNPSCS